MKALIGTLLTGAVFLSGCEMMQPQPDPTLNRLADIERRLAAVERVLASGSLIDLTVDVDDLQRQTAELQGRSDSLEHDMETTTARQRDLYADLDDRIRTIEQRLLSQAAPPASDADDAAPALPVPDGGDRQNYEAAFDLLKQQRYEEAGRAFRQFLVNFPDSQLADNAQYWLAESYYVTGQFDEALAQFELVTSAYSRSRKLPDALLKIGYSNYELGHWADARAALTRVRDEYPDSTAARLAEQRLTRMDDEGH